MALKVGDKIRATCEKSTLFGEVRYALGAVAGAFLWEIARRLRDPLLRWALSRGDSFLTALPTSDTVDTSTTTRREHG